MREVYLVSFFLFCLVFHKCRCNIRSRFQELGENDWRDTCKSAERNITLTTSYPNVTTKTLSSQSQNNGNTSFINIFELWNQFPLDIFTNVSSTSWRCQNDFNKYHEALLKNELNALKMFDASAKLPSGVLSGNINQYGDYDECMEVPKAHYCLAEVDVASMWRQPLSRYRDLVHSHFSIKETFDDPGHRVPGFSFTRWAFCIPNSCSSRDLAGALKEKLGITARVRPGLCQSSEKPKNKLAFGDYIARLYFALIVSAVCISTFLYNKMDFSIPRNKWYILLISFSLQYNISQLLKPCQKKEFKSVHGVRGLSALALLMAHKTMALLYNPYINRTKMTEAQAMEWSVIGRNAIIYTDCFLLISGLLNANALFDDLDKKEQRIRFKQKVLNRLFRILPSLLTIIMFCTYILPLMGSGPLWPLIINHHSTLCKKYMWRNMLLTHNYYGFEDMCLTHTHQLGIDMQLFLVTPIFVYAIWKFKTKGLCFVVLTALFSTGLRFWKTLEHNLSYVVHFGIPISRMFDTANYSYILPTHRATIYLIGVLLAYFLRNTNGLVFSKKQQVFIWTVAYTVGLTTWFGPVNMSVKGYEYNGLQSAVYGALSPITWGMAVAWVIYSIERGYQSWFVPILTWKYFQIFTRIAYGVYLVQFPVFFYNVGITRHVGEFKSYMMLPPIETAVILLISTVLTLFVEMPFQNIFSLISCNSNKYIF